MAAFGDRPVETVTTAEVSRFLRGLDRERLTPRNVNKHRQVLAAIFGYACRAETYGLATNPVAATDKRREAPPARLDYYEVEEVEALARVCERGKHRPTQARLPVVADCQIRVAAVGRGKQWSLRRAPAARSRLRRSCPTRGRSGQEQKRVGSGKEQIRLLRVRVWRWHLFVGRTS